jgi:hypothetical protein
MGRITGSASIETLVRVGLEKEAGLGPESKMVVLHDFNPCVDDELEVRRGQVKAEQRLNERGKAMRENIGSSIADPDPSIIMQE